MKLTAAAMLIALSTAPMCCASDPTPNGYKVTVCLTSDATAVPGLVRAKFISARMFKAIGVFIDWQPLSNKCPDDAIRVKLTSTPSSLRPGALAYALPYEGLHIQVFYDRIREDFIDDFMRGSVLAHVFVHEITHLLQGIKTHSAEGVMKGHWDSTDFLRMKENTLGFTQEDVNLIEQGLAVRQRLVMNTRPIRLNADR